jgi:hypothetical protein
MKISILLLAPIFLIPTAHAKLKCIANAIAVYHEVGFGISFDGGSSGTNFGEKSIINVPLSIDNRPACFIKQNSFKMQSEAKKGKEEENSITISPMKVEYENIPSPHQKQYVFVEKNPIKLLTKFHTMSFICAGELPLSIEASSDSVSKIIMDSNTANVSVHNVFATGIAAQNLKKGKVIETSTQETFDFFNKIYQVKTQKELMPDNVCCTDYRIPSIINDLSIKSLAGAERAIASSFTTMAANVPNGCSKDFADTMKNYQLENYTSNESLKDYKIKKKWFSDDLVFEW